MFQSPDGDSMLFYGEDRYPRWVIRYRRFQSPDGDSMLFYLNVLVLSSTDMESNVSIP